MASLLTNDKFFPYLMVLTGTAASIVAFWNSDSRRGVYWALAAAINFVVTL
jgi:hypothetical protein